MAKSRGGGGEKKNDQGTNRKPNTECQANQAKRLMAQPTNRFDALPEEGYEEEGVRPKRNTFKAPPIFVVGVQNIHPLKEL